MSRFFLYLSIFVVGFCLSIGLVKIYNKYSLNSIRVPNIPTINKQLNENPTEITENGTDTPVTEETYNSITNETEEIEIHIDTTLPPLKKLKNNKKALLTACKKKYTQYQNKNRYQWALAYTLSKTQKVHIMEFYVQDDIWSAFTKPQKTTLMNDLLYCDRTIQNNEQLKQLNIISISDDTILDSLYK